MNTNHSALHGQPSCSYSQPSLLPTPQTYRSSKRNKTCLQFEHIHAITSHQQSFFSRNKVKVQSSQPPPIPRPPLPIQQGQLQQDEKLSPQLLEFLLVQKQEDHGLLAGTVRQSFDKKRLRKIVNWHLKKFGPQRTLNFLDALKKAGFKAATDAAVSMNVQDCYIPQEKGDELAANHARLRSVRVHGLRGDVAYGLYFKDMASTWNKVGEKLKGDLVRYFKSQEVLNPVYMMAFSGARASMSQMRQLTILRGLMSNVDGQLVEVPILSNFREGLSMTEFILSEYGVQKGLTDTALNTAKAGYLTRKLTEVAHKLLISTYDCGTNQGIHVHDLVDKDHVLVRAADRMKGRVQPGSDYEVGGEAQGKLKLFARSPLTCDLRLQQFSSVCRLCYGWTSEGCLVPLGEAVGIIAAQSLGEPGTQLTMRTFHTGGVFVSGGSATVGFAPFPLPATGAPQVHFMGGRDGLLVLPRGNTFYRYRFPVDMFRDEVEEAFVDPKVPPVGLVVAGEGVREGGAGVKVVKPRADDDVDVTGVRVKKGTEICLYWRQGVGWGQ